MTLKGVKESSVERLDKLWGKDGVVEVTEIKNND